MERETRFELATISNLMNCQYCGCILVNYQKKYCSISHQNKAKNTFPRQKQCLFCNKTFSYGKKETRKKFCNQSCAAKFNNPLKTKIKTNKCKQCNNPTNKPEFCCLECKESFKLQSWLNGTLIHSNKYMNTPVFIKNYFLKINKNCCSLCGFSGVNIKTNNSILQIDHIDGNANNNSKENLRLICPNCHAMTPNYGALNKNSGRSWKIKYRLSDLRESDS